MPTDPPTSSGRRASGAGAEGDPLDRRIAEAADTLTATERRLAREVLGDPTAVAFGTVADLARRVGTSGPTVVRFAAKLGFDGFTALQEQSRRALADQLRRPTDRLRHQHPGDPWEQARAVAVSGVAGVFDSVSGEDLVALASPVAGTSGRVWVVASASSAAGHLLAGNLRLLRPGVRHLPTSGGDLAAELVDAAPGDVAVAIDFPRYERSVVETTRWLSEAGATVVAVSDGPLSPLAPLADVWCRLDVAAIGPFDSTLPTVALVEALLAEVTGQLRGAASERLERAESLWARSGLFADGEDGA